MLTGLKMPESFSFCGDLHPLLRIDVGRLQGIRLDELPPRLDFISHQHREHLVRLDRILDLHAQQAAHVRVHRGSPQLLGVHSARALEALAAAGVFDQ